MSKKYDTIFLCLGFKIDLKKGKLLLQRYFYGFLGFNKEKLLLHDLLQLYFI